MDDPKMYSEANSLPTTAAIQVLKEFSSKIKWRKSKDSVKDLGCGDGSVSTIIKSYMLCENAKFVASDVNANMIEYAKEHYAKENIEFRVLNAEEDLPNDLKSEFNHVFSFFMLQFVKDQKKAFQNIYDLLTEGGDCLLLIVKDAPVYDIFIHAARDTKWSTWITDLKKFISPYYYMQDPEKTLSEMMQGIGFTNIDVRCRKMLHVMKNGMELKHLMKAVEPFRMPEQIFEEFAQESVTVAHQLGLLEKNEKRFEDRTTPIDFNYYIMQVYATKP